MSVPAHNILPILIALPIIVWRMYGRVRRQIGRQTLTKVRPRITMILFPVLIVLLAFMAREHTDRLFALAGGLVAGSLLGVFGTRHTKFENTTLGMFYTPNAHLGIAVSLVFMGRVIYRLFQMYEMDPNAQPNPGDFASSPLTLAIFGLLAGYYVAYAVGLVRYRLRALREPAPTAAPG
ncbi:MAG: hypothetical protein ABI769_05000 [Pseudomonadota bacterium]